MSQFFRTILALVPALCTVCSSGCEKAPAPVVSSEPVRVFATVHAVADLARQVGGKYVQVDHGIENGRSLLNLQPSPNILAQKSNAQLVIAGGSEPWAIAEASNPRESTRVIRLDVIREAVRGTASSQPTTIQGDDAQIGLEWLDPVIAQRAANELAKRLTFMRSDHEVYFNARAKQFTDQIDALIAEYMPKFQNAPRRRVMSLTHEFDFLAERFDLDVVHVVGATADKIGEQQIGAIQRASRDEHLTTLLIRIDTPAGLIQDLSKRTGMRLVTMDPYGSSSADGHNTYLSVLRYNLDQLLDALSAVKS